MGKKPGNLLLDARCGALGPRSELPAALRARILDVGQDLGTPGFVRAVLLALVHCCDRANVRVRVADVQAWLGVHRELWLSERTIKLAVSRLVSDYGIQISSARGPHGGGYCFITTPGEAVAAVKPLMAEAKSLLHRCSLLSPRRRFFRRLAGQLEVQL